MDKKDIQTITDFILFLVDRGASRVKMSFGDREGVHTIKELEFQLAEQAGLDVPVEPALEPHVLKEPDYEAEEKEAKRQLEEIMFKSA